MTDHSRQKGQALALLAIALAAIVAGVAIVVDGGYAYAQRRASQNAADFAAMAGTRIIGQARTNAPVGGGQVWNAVDTSLTSNGATLVSGTYIDEDGQAISALSTSGCDPVERLWTRRGGQDRLAAVPAWSHRDH